MNKQKAQAQIIFLILILAVALFYIFFKPSEEKIPGPSSPSQPVFQEESTISSPKEEEPSAPRTPPAPDTAAPERFNGQPSGVLSAQTRKTTLTLETDKGGVCRYGTVAGMSYNSMSRIFSNTNSTFHSAQVTGLSEGQEYKYYVKCADSNNNQNTDDFIISFKVKEPDDFTPPVRSNQYPTGDILAAGTTQTMIGISTNEPASCRYTTGQGTSFGSMARNLADDGTKKYHTARITGLENGKSYNLFVRCQDLAGNVNTGDVMIYFSVGE